MAEREGGAQSQEKRTFEEEGVVMSVRALGRSEGDEDRTTIHWAQCWGSVGSLQGLVPGDWWEMVFGVGGQGEQRGAAHMLNRFSYTASNFLLVPTSRPQLQPDSSLQETITQSNVSRDLSQPVMV